MYTVIDKHNHFVLFVPLPGIEFSILAYQHKVQRVAGIRHTHFLYQYLCGLFIKVPVPFNRLKIGGAFLSIRFLEPALLRMRS